MVAEILKKKKLFLFDMDGTIYLDGEIFDGTLDMLDYIKFMRLEDLIIGGLL